MGREGTSKSAAIRIRKPMSFPEQVIGLIVVLFAALILIVSGEYPRQLVGPFCAVLVLSLLAYRRPEDVNRASERPPEHTATLDQTGVLEPSGSLVPESTPANSALPRRGCQDLVEMAGIRETDDAKYGDGYSAVGIEAKGLIELSTVSPAEAILVAKAEVDIPATEVAAAVMPAEPQWLYKDAIVEIGVRHTCRFDLGLSPLVFGPATEVMQIIDACLPADSLCDVTARSREIILLGREIYAALSSKCSQKRFVKAVMDAHDSMRAERKLPKLGRVDKRLEP